MSNHWQKLGKKVHIKDTQVGAVIRYETSKKLYLVADISQESGIEVRQLYSATQKYRSTINNFDVIELIPGGELTEKIAKQIDFLINSEFKFKKNIYFLKLYEEEMRKPVVS
jgi:hypothetical protein